MKLINTNDVYYDNDFEKWYFEDDEDFENAQVVEDNYVKENQELKKQLAEKDSEIKRHIDALEYWENNIPNQRQAIRKQVCDEIREKAEAFGNGVTGQLGYIVTLLLLDQIEKGEGVWQDQ